MKKLACREIGMKDCNFEATGNTDDEVMRKGKEHAMAVHHHQVTPDEESQARRLIKNA